MSSQGHSTRHPDSHGGQPVAEAANDQTGAWFEIYLVPALPAATGRGPGEEWGWRLCAADGQIMATSGPHDSLEKCRHAVGALQAFAAGARIE